MSSPEKNLDPRTSFRCPVSGSPREGELQVGSVRLPVRLLDESAEGFAVLASEPPGVEAGDVAQLYTEVGGFEVWVANMVQVDPVETEDPEEAEESAPAFRLGLYRLGELDPSDEGQESCAGRCIRFLLVRLIPSRACLVSLGRMIAGVGVAVLLGATVLLWTTDDPSATPAAKRGSRVSTSSSSRRTSWFQQLSATKKRSTTPKEATGSRQGRAMVKSAADNINELYVTAQRLPGATAFSLPEVSEELKLTTDQQDQIRRIIGQTGREMQEVRARRQGDTAAQISEERGKLLEAAHREAVDLLTDEQRARWEESRKYRQLRSTVQDLPGAASFCLPEVIERLELTTAQQDQIYQLVQWTVQTMREVNLRWSKGGRQQLSEKRAKVLDVARRQALDLLSDQQRAQWEELFE